MKRLLHKITEKTVKRLADNMRIKEIEKACIKAKARGPVEERYKGRKVVCVATTIPSRIDVLHYSIESIIHQSVRPHKIVLYLGKELFAGIELPESLRSLEQYGVEYRFVEDVMVHTKYFYAFQEFPDAYVMTFDDDNIYHPELLEELLRVAEKEPGCIICGRAHEICGNAKGEFLKYMDWNWEAYSTKPTHMLLPTGVGGVLYQPNMFDKEIFDKNLFLKLSPKADDLWLKCMELKSGIPTVTLKVSKWQVGVDGSQEVSLNSGNVHQNRNDVYWSNLMQHYGMSYAHIQDMEKALRRR